MQFSKIRVVLVATSHPGNIGASARALKTMGFDRLYLVAPKFFPHSKAIELAAGAEDILDKAVVVQTLPEALADCQLSIAVSARPRGLALPGFDAAEAAEFIKTCDDTEVAIVFGSEKSGLTNEEILCCQYHLAIPANPEYSSLNLSQAVQIVLYELRKKFIEHKEIKVKQEPLANFAEVEHLFGHLTEVLLAINFLKLNNPGRVLPRLRRMFSRIKLERMEVNMWRGILSQIEKSLKKE